MHYQPNNSPLSATQRLSAAACVAVAACIPVLGAADAPIARQDTPKTAPAKSSSTDAAPAPGANKDVPGANKAAPTLDETRLTLSKWIETQQIISKERNDWQQGKEILQGLSLIHISEPTRPY